ncbi:nucleoside-triphosphatase [Pseudoflavonifractor capillosus]|uniref:Nucleoside-triphosphatase n=1 Tax=Pseudoflavonifractor capillosus TaxID=106588 RepID=A0A921MJN7_9FIRM|nr:nucleoside-triphosphatase [Pseudoflavonifractor capillosus]HJG85814.1 nucleoside-triphosphatase [Pseudoflavonifractor capillosus]
MKHVFLTGAVQCGKSTVVTRVLEAWNGGVGGFRTGFGPDRACPERLLYLWSASESARYDSDHAVVKFFNGCAPQPIPGRFDTLGTACLTGTPALWVMDECGRLERDALAFQRAILEKLEGDTPVLGVVREGFPGWTRAIADHLNVELITVTEGNRDALPELIRAQLRAE